MRRWGQTPHGKAHKAAYTRWYVSGWTKDLTDAALLKQGGKCAICKRKFGDELRICRDHKHVRPPQPRGLLCNACNSSLGHYEKQQRAAGLVLVPYEEYIAAYE